MLVKVTSRLTKYSYLNKILLNLVSEAEDTRIFIKMVQIALRIFLIAVTGTSMLCMAAQGRRRVEGQRQQNIVSDDFASGAYRFAFDLYKKVIGRYSDKNIVLSPITIRAVLAMAYIGASGDTADEISRGLYLGRNLPNVSSSFNSILNDVDRRTIKIANKIYIQEGFNINREYDRIVREKYFSSVENVNFSNAEYAAKTINDWVKYITKNKIDRIVDPISVDAATAILINAVHFQALWKTPFDTRSTTNQTFWLNETHSKQVDMMSGTFYASSASFSTHYILIIPYRYEKYFLYIAMPKEKNGLAELEEKFANRTSISEYTFMFDRHYNRSRTVKLPKFEIEFSIELMPILKEMGMREMFKIGADFSKLTSSPKFAITEVAHKGFIKVDEKGTESVADSHTSGILIGRVPQIFKVDRPFLYFIVDRFMNVFFMGRVLDPAMN